MGLDCSVDIVISVLEVCNFELGTDMLSVSAFVGVIGLGFTCPASRLYGVVKLFSMSHIPFAEPGQCIRVCRLNHVGTFAKPKLTIDSELELLPGLIERLGIQK